MQIKNLQEIFHNKYFIIPSYQRGYAWQPKQLKDFWSDLLIKNETKTNHYTGVITLKINSQKDSQLTEYEVIDGQQRLTTIIILINEILNKLPQDDKTKEQKNLYIFDEKNYKYKLEYHKDTPSNIYFKQEILNKETEKETAKTTFYTNNLLNSKNFFKEELNKKSIEEIQVILNTLTQNFMLNEYIIDNNFNIHEAFETMNNRGKHLSTLELLKNRFLSLAPYLCKDDNPKLLYFTKNINQIYNTIYHYLGKEANNPLDDDEFLSNHWLSYPDFYYNRKEAKTFSSELLDTKFTLNAVIKEQKTTYEKTEEYLKSLSASSKSYYAIHYPDNSDQNIKTNQELLLLLNKLSILNLKTFRPLIMNTITLYTDNKIELSDTIDLFKKIEQFIIIIFAFSGYSTTYRNNSFYNLAKKLAKDKKPKDIEIEIDNILNNSGAYKNNKLDFTTFKRYSKIKDGNFYNWHYINYLLYQYELNLHNIAKKDNQNISNDIKLWVSDKQDSIEHIAPQNPKKEDLNNYWTTNFSTDTYNKSIHLLGNLLLLRQSSNSSLGNNSFTHKKDYYKKDSLSSIEVSEINNWNEEEIIKKGEKILQFASKNWHLNLTAEEIKILATGNF